VAAAALAPAAARDSGRFAAVLLGVPVVLAALPVGWDLVTGRPQAAIDWPAAILAMGWAVLLALGIGLAFVPAALVEAIRLRHRHPCRRIDLRIMPSYKSRAYP
jgi:hypothetical protein